MITMTLLNVILEVLPAVTVKITISWYLTTCRLLAICQWSGEICCLHLRDIFRKWRQQLSLQHSYPCAHKSLCSLTNCFDEATDMPAVILKRQELSSLLYSGIWCYVVWCEDDPPGSSETSIILYSVTSQKTAIFTVQATSDGIWLCETVDDEGNEK